MADDTTAHPGRRPVTRRLRFEILRRDNQTCRYCGAQAPDVPLTVDHVIPTALGGGDDPTNLVTACRDCNTGKSSTSPDAQLVADVDATALLFAKAIERVNEQRKAQLRDLDRMVDDFQEEWNHWKAGGYAVPLPNGWRSSITRFLEQGLTVPELCYLVDIAMESRARSSETFRYFCGCVWREVSTRQEMARRLIEDTEV
jgi:hypothetical protein